eukprot:scaffold574_cov190-Amphora_coffeaeformis.AAC.3
MFTSSRGSHSKNFGSSWGEKSFGSIKGMNNNNSFNDSYTFFKGNESATDITLSSSLSSFDDDEFAALNLIKDIDLSMIDLNKRKIKMEKKIDNVLELSQARYECGNEVGAIMSMRKVYRNRSKVALMVTARSQLVKMRKQVESYMKQGDFDFDVQILRNRARGIISKINSPTNVSDPSDIELLREVYDMMGMVEI